MQRDPVPLTCALSMTRTRFPSRVTLRSGHLQVGIPDACLGICAPAVKILELSYPRQLQAPGLASTTGVLLRLCSKQGSHRAKGYVQNMIKPPKST